MQEKFVRRTVYGYTFCTRIYDLYFLLCFLLFKNLQLSLELCHDLREIIYDILEWHARNAPIILFRKKDRFSTNVTNTYV